MGEVVHLTCQTRSPDPIAFTSLLRHTSGAVSVVDASHYTWHSPELFPQTLELLEGYRLRLHTPDDLEEFDVEPSVPSPWHGVQDSVMRFQSHVLDNLKPLALALAAYDSAQTGIGHDPIPLGSGPRVVIYSPVATNL